MDDRVQLIQHTGNVAHFESLVNMALKSLRDAGNWAGLRETLIVWSPKDLNLVYTAVLVYGKPEPLPQGMPEGTCSPVDTAPAVEVKRTRKFAA